MVARATTPQPRCDRADQVGRDGTGHRAASDVTSVDHDQGLHLSAVGVRVDPAQYLVNIRCVGQLELVGQRPPGAPEVHPVDRLALTLDDAGIDSSNVKGPSYARAAG